MLAIGAGLTLVNLLWRPAPEIIHTLYSGNQSTEQVALPDGSTLWARSQLLVPVRRGFFGQGTTGGAQRPGVLRGGGRSLPTVRREQQWHRRHGSGNGFRSLFRSRGPARGGHLAQRQRTCTLPGVTKQTFTLSPDQKFTYSADTRKVIVSRVDAQRYTLWHERMSLSFENQPLSVILPRLERWYNCHIDCPEEIATRYHYTFSLSDETLDRTLQLLQSSTDQTPLFYRRDGMYVRIYRKNKKRTRNDPPHEEEPKIR